MQGLNSSIKWKLMLMNFFMVLAPVLVLGILSYRSVENEIFKQVEEDLGHRSLDWQNIATQNAELIDTILNREDELVRQQVAAISIDVKKMMELVVQQYGINPPGRIRQALYNKIASIKVGKTGYVYLIDRVGNYVVSKDRIRDGENIWNAKDANGRYFIQEMVNAGRVLQGDAIYPIDYPWQNTGETVPRMKLAGISYFKPWDVIIGASSYYSDFKSSDIRTEQLETLKNKIAMEKIGSGYIWVVNSKGEYIVSKDRQRDGENIRDAKDANGVYFIQEMIKNAKQLDPGKYYIQYYPCKIREKHLSG